MRMDRWTGIHTYMTKVIGAFCNFANAPEKTLLCLWCQPQVDVIQTVIRKEASAIEEGYLICISKLYCLCCACIIRLWTSASHISDTCCCPLDYSTVYLEKECIASIFTTEPSQRKESGRTWPSLLLMVIAGFPCLITFMLTHRFPCRANLFSADWGSVRCRKLVPTYTLQPADITQMATN